MKPIKPKVRDMTNATYPDKPSGAGKGDKWRRTNWEAYRASPFWQKREEKKQNQDETN